MTEEEARKIAEIIGTADNGCIDCVESLCLKMNEAFADWNWSVPDEYQIDVADPIRIVVLVTKVV